MEWLLLIATVSGQEGSLRLRFWRQLKAAGGASLRDGVYLLPWKEALYASLRDLRSQLVAAGGNAYVLRLPEQDSELQEEWLSFFDRSCAYREWRAELGMFMATFAGGSEPEARKQLRQFRKELDAIVAIDYFPGEAREQAQRALHVAEASIARHYSPDEPLPAAGDIPRLDRKDFQSRRWATRRRPWVDRIASAWLIRRFIDTDATFVWLNDPHECPPDAFGFDFDGAAFTHIGDKVSFEVLLTAFSLDSDPALAKLGALVHALDIGGDPVPEAQGFEAILAGSRSRLTDDDQLLLEMSGILDSLYAHYKSACNADVRRKSK